MKWKNFNSSSSHIKQACQ